MKADTVLDYAAFQLSPKRTRCELFVSGDGESEKLGPTILKPLLTHLPRAEEQVNGSGYIIKLELSENENGARWFTKGTLERFVLFVGNPEMLELVNAIEEEMFQLEDARKFHFALYSQGSSSPPSDVGFVTGIDGRTHGAPLKLTRDSEAADDSKNELLRAIDARLMTLHQELKMAFARVAAAGFSAEHISDLIFFADRFQAIRLRDACTKFLFSFQKRQQQVSSWKQDVDTYLLGSDISIENKTTYETPGALSNQVDKSNEKTGNILKENQICRSSIALQPELDSLCSSSITDNLMASPGISSYIDNPDIETCLKSVNKASGGFKQPTLDKDDQSSVATSMSFVRTSSPRRRSASPMRRVQVGRTRRSNSVATRSINYFPELSNRESHTNRESESSDADNESGSDNEVSQPMKSEPTRRLSVQDAINLFESKQREQKGSTEAIKKNAKFDGRRLSSDIGSSITCEKAVLRRWSGASEMGKPHEQSSVSDNTVHSLTNDNDICQVEATQSEFRPITDERRTEERRNIASRLLSPPKVREAQKMQGRTVQRTGLQYAEASALPCDLEACRGVESSMGSTEMNRENQFSVVDSSSRIGSETADGFLNTRRPRVEPTAKIRLSEGNHELNLDLQEKVDQLGIFYSSHKIHGQAVDEGSAIPLPGKSSVQLEAGTDWKILLSDVKPEGPTAQEQMHVGNQKEESHEIDMFMRTKPELDQMLRSVENTQRDPTGSSRSNKTDLDMQALMNMVDSNCTNYEEQLGGCANDKSSDDLRGKFYDQYREKRDAKLREEQNARRAEKEAKLKSMQEVLERRKAEMSGKSAGSSEKRDPLVHARLRTQKVQSSKGRFLKNKKEQDEADEDGEEGETNDLHEQSARKENQKIVHSKSTSGDMLCPSVQCISKDLPKANVAKKISSRSMPAAAVRSSVSLTTSSSPRLSLSKVSSTNSASTGRRKIQSAVAENPLARSVPNISDLKKENTKPSPGRSALNSTQEKSGPKSREQCKGNNHNKGGSEASHIETNRSRPGSRSFNRKEEKKNSSQVMRKTGANVSEIKSDFVITYEAGASKPSFYNKVTKKSSVVPLESKPFLRKGSGIGPGVGPGIAKMKASPPDDAPKNAEDGVQVDDHNIAETADELRHVPSSDALEGIAEQNKVDHPVSGAVEISEAQSDSDTSQNNMHDNAAVNKTSDWSEDCGSDNNCISDNDRTIPTVLQEDNTGASPSKLLSCPPVTDQGNNEEITSSSDTIMEEGHIEPSMPATSLSELPPLVSTVSSHLNASVSTLDSPLRSPTSSSSHMKHSLSQMLEAESDSSQARQKWGSAQKPVFILSRQSQKDARKGLKRLLKFGRKSHSETITTEWVSASPLSEADEDTEQSKNPSGSNVDGQQKNWMQAKGSGQGKFPSERNYNFGSTGGSSEGECFHEPCTSKPIPDTIAAQPPAIKLREEHVPTATLLKAPRSFFSLSTFRSKGSDSKSR